MNMNKCVIPTINQASDDLKLYEQKYEKVCTKYKSTLEATEKLKLEKQSCLAIINDCQRKISLHNQLLSDLLTESQSIALKMNKAKLMDCSISEKIKRMEEESKKERISAITLDIKVEPKPKTNMKDLVVKKQKLEKAIEENRIQLKEYTEQFNLRANF